RRRRLDLKRAEIYCHNAGPDSSILNFGQFRSLGGGVRSQFRRRPNDRDGVPILDTQAESKTPAWRSGRLPRSTEQGETSYSVIGGANRAIGLFRLFGADPGRSF